MESEKIDRLFREKLHNIEVTPSKNAWAEVNNQIQTKAITKAYYWIAASLFPVLVTAALIFNQETTPKSDAISLVDWPAKLEANTKRLHIAFIDVNEINEKIALSNTSKIINEPKGLVRNNTLKNTSTIVELTPIKEKMSVATVDLSKELAIDPLPVATSKDNEIINEPLKITYIASKLPLDEDIVTQDSISTFNKVIAFADNLTPENVFIGIKTAKDNLLSGNFKSKRSKNSL